MYISPCFAILDKQLDPPPRTSVSSLLSIFFKILFIYPQETHSEREREREREREAETQAEGEAGSKQGARCGT